MDRLALTLQHPFCQSPPAKDQLFYPNTSIQSAPSSWPPSVYTMDLGDPQSDPATPDGQGNSFYHDSETFNDATGPMDYIHTKTLSNGSSMEGAPRNSAEDSAPFTQMGASQPHENHKSFQQTLRLSGQRHTPSSYAAHTHMQMNSHGPPLASHPSLTPYGESSMPQRAPPNFMRHPGFSALGNDNGNQMHSNHSGNPHLYHLAFNGMELPPPSPSTPSSNWDFVHNNGYPHIQGGPLLQQSAYGSMGMPPNLATLGQGQSLFTNVGIAQIQRYLGLSNQANSSSLTNSPNTTLSYGMNMAAPNMTHGGPEASQLGLSITGNVPSITRPQSQSTMSTPSLAGNSPTLPWSPSFESASQGGTSASGSISYPAPAVRGPPTPPQLVDDVMPPKPNPPKVARKVKSPTATITPKPRNRSCGASTSISSARSASSVSPSPVPVSPAPTAVSLRHRLNALPKDKRTLFERAVGDLWNPRSQEDQEDGLDRSQVILLEDFLALIGSEQLRNQTEIPDDLVEPLLRTILLPRADAHKGSRGGAAGHLCLWAGCGKTIKRLDHSRNHIREHVRSKPHTCGGQGLRGCGQTFLRMDDLKRHQKSHCSVLRSGPGRRPRSIRGTRRDTDEEEEERDSEDSTSLNGGDDDDYRPIHARVQSSVASSTSATRELASRLRSQRQRAARYVGDESTEESDSTNHDHVIGRHQTSNVRRAVESPVENRCEGDEEDGLGKLADSQKVWLAYS